MFRDEGHVAQRSSSCTQKRITSAGTSVLWVARPAAQVSGETFFSLYNKTTCSVRTFDDIPTCAVSTHPSACSCLQVPILSPFTVFPLRISRECLNTIAVTRLKSIAHNLLASLQFATEEIQLHQDPLQIFHHILKLFTLLWMSLDVVQHVLTCRHQVIEGSGITLHLSVRSEGDTDRTLRSPQRDLRPGPRSLISAPTKR